MGGWTCRSASRPLRITCCFSSCFSVCLYMVVSIACECHAPRSSRGRRCERGVRRGPSGPPAARARPRPWVRGASVQGGGPRPVLFIVYIRQRLVPCTPLHESKVELSARSA